MKTTRRWFLGSASVTALAAIFSSGAESDTSGRDSAPSDGVITTEEVQNFSGSSSPGFVRMGLQFAKGEVPAGKIPQLSRNQKPILGVQFDERVTWSDGSLKTCVCHIRDTQWSGDETRSYQVSAVPGVYSNTGTKTLSNIARTHDFKIAFSGVTDYQDKTYGSGAFTASFNTMCATATRTYKYHSGPVCESWEVWGLAADNATGLPDTHLKTIWYVSIWKDAAGNIADFEYGAVVALNWWNLENLPPAGNPKPKTQLAYTATLLNGATMINTYSLIGPKGYHPYRSEWMTVRTDDDDNHARRYWVNQIPTLFRKFDKTHAVKTGLFPPLDTKFSPVSNFTLYGASRGTSRANYAPCHNQFHRPQVDDVGGYMGRGVMPNTDCIAFMRQTSSDYRYARTNAFAGLHIPYHYRSNFRQGDKYVETKDITNAAVALQFWRGKEIAADFSAVGMNAPINAYLAGTTPPLTNTPYHPVSGQTLQGATGNGAWSPSLNSTHAVAYSYFMYMLEGERHFMQATLDLFTNCAHQRGEPHNYIYHGVEPFQTQLSIPATIFAPVSAYPIANDSRNAGWSFLLAAHGAVVCPDADPQSGFIKLLQTQNSYFAKQNVSNYFPAQQNALGPYKNIVGDSYQADYFMNALQVLGFATMATACEDADALNALSTCVANVCVSMWGHGLPYLAGYERFYMMLDSTTPFDPVTNPMLTPATVLAIEATASLSGDVLTWATAFGLKPTDGDVLYAGLSDGSKNLLPIPPELTLKTPYYAINSSGYDCQLSATPGGSPLALSNSIRVTSGVYDSKSGRVSLALARALPTLRPGVRLVVSDLTGVGSVSGLNITQSANGAVDSTHFAYNAASGLGDITITGGTVSFLPSFGVRPQSANVTPSQNPPGLASADGNINIMRAATVLSFMAGASNITREMCKAATEFESTVSQTEWVAWNMTPSPNAER